MSILGLSERNGGSIIFQIKIANLVCTSNPSFLNKTKSYYWWYTGYHNVSIRNHISHNNIPCAYHSISNFLYISYIHNKWTKHGIFLWSSIPCHWNPCVGEIHPMEVWHRRTNILPWHRSNSKTYTSLNANVCRWILSIYLSIYSIYTCLYTHLCIYIYNILIYIYICPWSHYIIIDDLWQGHIQSKIITLYFPSYILWSLNIVQECSRTKSSSMTGPWLPVRTF